MLKLQKWLVWLMTLNILLQVVKLKAFILEMNLIKKHHPKYNIMLMDDKRYPYICISNEKNPRIYYTRDLNKKAKYYGPYPNALAAKRSCGVVK